MLPILKSYLSPTLEQYARGVSLISETQTPLSQQLERVVTLSEAIAQFSAAKGVKGKRAQASVWHMHYTLQIMPSVLFVHSVLNRKLPFATEQVSIDTNHWQLQLPHQGTAMVSQPTLEKYDSFIFEHLVPLHRFLVQHFGVPEPVLWSNCAFRLRQFFPTILNYTGRRKETQEDFETLTQSKYLGQLRNPFYAPRIELSDTHGPYQLRASCCFLHKVSNSKLCRDCPKQPHHADARQQQRALYKTMMATNGI
ncbi:siderophore-iron reductase FhuF [Pseudoalteromonas peptidolytica]|uniref:siderophore-iron reductase FhuF n=1 Tax=Pseudoalteromonas peptidolytica TaxID=61150 RepID=UPI00298E43A2|nr:siderophore-iron reductase FhuF [Pseudoalteromonas peptidolytica]MDW7550798.1 siderophore-iron reductase FhuF [Pseudoalteromonas peptidolytica]